MLYTLTLLLLATFPPFFFLARLLVADRREPEPLEMVLFTLALGIISTLPASFAERVLGSLPFFAPTVPFSAIITAFVRVAPIEEACKLAVVLLFVWGNENFNEENDGIVYVATSSIGFALFENILYVLSNGFGVGVLRAVTSIPLHAFCGVLMGSCVGRARFARTRGAAAALVLRGFALAWFFHGLYDSLALSGSGFLALVGALVVALTFYGNRAIARGRALSLARWANPAAAPTIRLDPSIDTFSRAVAKYGANRVGVDELGRAFLKPERQTWKAIASRTLFLGSLIVAALMSKSVDAQLSSSPALFASRVCFAIQTLTVPVMLGVLLELSYQRRRSRPHYFSQ